MSCSNIYDGRNAAQQRRALSRYAGCLLRRKSTSACQITVGEDLQRLNGKSRSLIDGEGLDKESKEDKLLQIFTETVIGPIFFESSSSAKATEGFGEGNFRALFESVRLTDCTWCGVAMTGLKYLSGFGNEHATERLPARCRKARNSPQRRHSIYVEQVSGDYSPRRAITICALGNIACVLGGHSPHHAIDKRNLRTAPNRERMAPPDRLRWDPLPMPAAPTDFVDGLHTMLTNGDASLQRGIGVHLYRQPVDDALLLRRGRRVADRATTGRTHTQDRSSASSLPNRVRSR